MDSNSLPILDFSQQDGLAESLLHACRNYGFFYLTNHGVSSELIEDVFEQSKAFFSLPLENKMECLVDKNGRGYTRMREEKLDPSMQTIGDTKEGYYIGRESDKNLPLHGANQWPSKVLLPRWREVMTDYQRQMTALGLRLTRLLGVALGLGLGYFDTMFSEPMTFVRLLHYEAVQSDLAKGVMGAGAHTDYGMWTLLKTDRVPGLQIMSLKGEWVDVPYLDGAFIVNLGDMLQFWTSGLLRSTIHRVVNHEGRERYSIPFFYEPNYDTVIKTLPSEVVQSYMKEQGIEPEVSSVTSGEWLLNKYKQTHEDIGKHFTETPKK